MTKRETEIERRRAELLARSAQLREDIARTGARHQCPYLACCRIDALEAGRAIFELPVDQLLEALHPVT